MLRAHHGGELTHARDVSTGMQLRSSTTEPISAPSASSEMVPTAAGAPGVNHGSSRSWSSSRETSSSTGMTPSAEQLAGESPSASKSSTVMYTRAAPALRAAAAALSEVTSAQTSPRSFKSAGHTGSLCTIKWFTRSAYGARMDRSSASHAAARTLVDRRKSHTAALVKLDVEAYRLKWRRAHAAHVLDQVFR